MTIIIVLILEIIFIFLAGVHIYWAFGGKWGSKAVIPTKEDKDNVVMPGPIGTFIVAIGLLGFGAVIWLNAMAIRLKFISCLYPMYQYGLWIIASLFMLRAIGEFKYVGFFKKYKYTKFGKNDTRYYIPLCLLISLLAIILEFIKG